MKKLTYLELHAEDPAAAAAFYHQVLGWKVEQRGDGSWRFEDADAQLIGRWRTEPAVVFYSVKSVDHAIASVAAAGGTVIEGPRPEGDTTIARLRDPAGNVIGIWQFNG